jgi:hypothetical protein
LAEALVEDPYFKWLAARIPSFPSAQTLFERKVRESFRQRKALEATPGFEAVAIWDMSGMRKDGPNAGIPQDIDQALQRIAASAPAEPNYFLDWLGTRPSERRQGHAAKALAPPTRGASRSSGG